MQSENPTQTPHVPLRVFRLFGTELTNNIRNNGGDDVRDDDFLTQPVIADIDPPFFATPDRRTQSFTTFVSQNDLLLNKHSSQRTMSSAGFDVDTVADAATTTATSAETRKEPTHTSLTGGSYHVPLHLQKQFIAVYVNSLRAGCKHSINEVANDTFPMFFDIDLKFAVADLVPASSVTGASSASASVPMSLLRSTDLIDNDLFRAFIGLVPALIVEISRWFNGEPPPDAPPATAQSTANAARLHAEAEAAPPRVLPPPPNLRCNVLANEKAAPEYDERTMTWYVRLGYHVIFPYLMVDSRIALQLRAGCLAALRRFVTELPAPNRWDTAIDYGVYLGHAHLRMPLCYKSVRCTVCKPGAKLPDCKCDGYAIHHNRRYWLVCCYRFDDRIVHFDPATYNMFVRDPTMLVEHCSIRRFNQPVAKNFYAYPRSPRFNGASPSGDIDTRKPSKFGAAGGKAFDEDKKGIGSGKKFYVSRDSPVFATLEMLVHQFDILYRRVRVRDILTNADMTWYKVLVDGEGAHFCHNVRRDHNSNSVYFYVTRAKQVLVQRCWCQCKTIEGRHTGKFCSEYESEPGPINNRDCQILFSNAPAVHNGSQYADMYTLLNNNADRNMKRGLADKQTREYKEARLCTLFDILEETSQTGFKKSSSVMIKALSQVQPAITLPLPTGPGSKFSPAAPLRK